MWLIPTCYRNELFFIQLVIPNGSWLALLHFFFKLCVLCLCTKKVSGPLELPDMGVGERGELNFSGKQDMLLTADQAGPLEALRALVSRYPSPIKPSPLLQSWYLGPHSSLSWVQRQSLERALFSSIHPTQNKGIFQCCLTLKKMFPVPCVSGSPTNSENRSLKGQIIICCELLINAVLVNNWVCAVWENCDSRWQAGKQQKSS